MLKRKSIKTLILVTLVLCAGSSILLQAQTLPGDVNNDGIVTIVDALMIAQHYVGLAPAGFQAAGADVDGNSFITIVDALLVAQYCVGLISQFPVETRGDIEIVKSAQTRNMSPASPASELETVVAGNNQLCFDLYRQLKNEPGNLFYSPVSLYYAMAMAYAGANGSSETEIAAGMHFDLPEPNLHNALNALDLTLTSPPANPNPDFGEEMELYIVNSTWGQRDYFFFPGFLDTLAINYGAGLNTVDFKTDPDNCRLLINDWVSDQTRQRIEDLLPGGSIDTLTRLVLVNAIYFKANWLKPFRVENTVPAPFYPAGGGSISTMMMNQTLSTGYYEVPGQYQVVKLRYQGSKRNSMLIILPAAGQLTAFENSLSLDTYARINQNIRQYLVELGLPTFSYEWDSSLKPVLMALGIQQPFDQIRADFSGITDEEQLFITDVVQKAFVAVDEIGTEAAAATAVIFGTTSVPEHVVMTVNRPFLFVIMNDDTNTILFTGRVMQP